MDEGTLVGGFFAVLGVVILAAGVAGAYRYAVLQRIPETSPRNASDGQTVSMTGTITGETTTVESPFGREECAVAVWKIEDRSRHGGSDDWMLADYGLEHGDEIAVDVDGEEVVVDLPADFDPENHLPTGGLGAPQRDFPYGDCSIVVEEGERPPPHVQQFERARDVEPLADRFGKSVRRYSAARFEPGDEVTVYGTVRLPGGTPDDARLVDDGRFLVSSVDAGATETRTVVMAAVLVVAGLFSTVMGLAFVFA